MAPSPAEIQAQIRLTRRAIDARLDEVNRQVSYRRWAPYAFLASAAILGLGLSRLPVLRLVRLVGAGAATALTVVHAYDTVRDRLIRPGPDDPREPGPGSKLSGSAVRPPLSATAAEPRVGVPATEGPVRPGPRFAVAAQRRGRARRNAAG